MVVKFLNSYWSALPKERRRYMVYGLVLALLTLLLAEGYARVYGSIENQVIIPSGLTLYLFEEFSLSTRKLLLLFRGSVLTLWGFYVAYILYIRPALSSAKLDYQKYRGALPPPLALLKAVPNSQPLVDLISVVGSIFTYSSVSRIGFFSTLILLSSLLLLFLLSCYASFKAGRYPGSEEEFWGEVLEAGGGPAAWTIGQRIAAAGVVAAGLNVAVNGVGHLLDFRGAKLNVEAAKLNVEAAKINAEAMVKSAQLNKEASELNSNKSNQQQPNSQGSLFGSIFGSPPKNR